jgi:hypothetical protein
MRRGGVATPLLYLSLTPTGAQAHFYTMDPCVMHTSWLVLYRSCTINITVMHSAHMAIFIIYAYKIFFFFFISYSLRLALIAYSVMQTIHILLMSKRLFISRPKMLLSGTFIENMHFCTQLWIIYTVYIRLSWAMHSHTPLPYSRGIAHFIFF